jgi:hypothetical protein
MATFYVLPPRPLFEDSLNSFIKSWFPGLALSQNTVHEMAEAIQAHCCSGCDDTFLVFRDDLPDESDSSAALREHFGADFGDDVIELRLGARHGELVQRSWRVGDVSAA